MGWKTEYWKANLRRSLPATERAEGLMSILGPLINLLVSFGIGLLIAFGIIPEKWGSLGVSVAGVTIGLLLYLALQMLVLSPMSLWRQQRDKLLVYETPTLSLSYDDADTSCKGDELLGDGQLGRRLWRVGIRGAEGTITKGVVVKLEAIEPSISDLPQALHPMDGRWTGLTNGWEGDGSFEIRPGATIYVDVIRYTPSHGQERSQLGIVLQSSYPDSPLPFRTHTLTLSAQGQEGPRIIKRFQLEVNPDNLTRFYPLDVSAS